MNSILLAMAEQHKGRGDDCGRLARLVLESVAASGEAPKLLTLLVEARGMLDAIGCSPEGSGRDVAEAEELAARIDAVIRAVEPAAQLTKGEPK